MALLERLSTGKAVLTAWKDLKAAMEAVVPKTVTPPAGVTDSALRPDAEHTSERGLALDAIALAGTLGSSILQDGIPDCVYVSLWQRLAKSQVALGMWSEWSGLLAGSNDSFWVANGLPTQTGMPHVKPHIIDTFIKLFQVKCGLPSLMSALASIRGRTATICGADTAFATEVDNLSVLVFVSEADSTTLSDVVRLRDDMIDACKDTQSIWMKAPLSALSAVVCNCMC